MSITSFYYMFFLAVGVVLYYLTPGRAQWITMLGLSIVFYYCVATPYTIIYLLIATTMAYLASHAIASPILAKQQHGRRWITILTVLAIVFNILLWFLLKGSALWLPIGQWLHRLLPALPLLHPLPLASALGMGYYTAQLIGYLLDCYWGISPPQPNFLKLFLFVCFFPQLTVGPISKQAQLACLYTSHPFCCQNLAFGSQRILWGLFKKLVIADRISPIIQTIWADTLQYNGIWIWLAVLLYPLHIYADFSGCMDIVLGSAELFDIHLPENFRNPFWARNCQEFWQRWHITLGVWARDHVYYPTLKGRWIAWLGHWSRQHLAKRPAKLLPWAIGMGVLWFVMGFWHGSSQHIIGTGVYFWLMFVLSEIFAPVTKRITARLQVDTHCFSWQLWQRARTYLIYAVGMIFFSAENLANAWDRLHILLRSFTPARWNPWILVDGSLRQVVGSYANLNLLLINLLILFLVDTMREKHGSLRRYLAAQILPFRWLVYLLLFFAVIIFGLYGPKYNASSFIYGQF